MKQRWMSPFPFSHLFLFLFQTEIAITPDGRFAVAPTGEDTKLVFLELATGRSLELFDDQPAVITCADISRDGRFALTGDQDGTICLWRLGVIQ
jgi:WD40 repeat protein